MSSWIYRDGKAKFVFVYTHWNCTASQPVPQAPHSGQPSQQCFNIVPGSSNVPTCAHWSYGSLFLPGWYMFLQGQQFWLKNSYKILQKIHRALDGPKKDITYI